jgi:phenylacetate-CoA ligase
MADTWAQGLWAFGVRPDDIAYFAFAYGPFIGFWIAHNGFERIGALTIPSGGMTSEARIKHIIELGVTVVVATPTYGLRLGQTAREMGIDLANQSKVRLTVHAGEPGASIPSTKHMLESMWGAKCGDFGGMSECGANFYFDCGHNSGGVHIHEDHFLQEVINPITTEPAAFGERGELVITAFGRGTLPAIRYRTGDLVERVPADMCTCGRTFDLYRGAIIGRADDMKLIRGVNVYPSAVENIIRLHHEIDEFQVLLTREGFQDEITIRVDLAPSIPTASYKDIADNLADELAEAHEGLRFKVVAVESGALPRFELKSRRLLDQRSI